MAQHRGRTWMDPSIPDWRQVPNETKEFLWTELKKVFQYPRGTKEEAKEHALKQFGQSYRRWRWELNTNFVKKNLTPFNEYGRITPTQWKEFVRQKTSETAQNISTHFSEMAKKNMHRPFLGPGGYRAHVDKWNREREGIIVKGLSDLYEGLNDRAFGWVKACEVKNAEGNNPAFLKPETEEVVGKIKEYAELEKAGKWVPNREIYSLRLAIGTKEHRGRVRGISSKLSWKEGFAEDRHMYKKYDRYKQLIHETAERMYTEKWGELLRQSVMEVAQQAAEGHMASAQTPVPQLSHLEDIINSIRSVKSRRQHHVRYIFLLASTAEQRRWLRQLRFLPTGHSMAGQSLMVMQRFMSLPWSPNIKKNRLTSPRMKRSSSSDMQ